MFPVPSPALDAAGPSAPHRAARLLMRFMQNASTTHTDSPEGTQARHPGPRSPVQRVERREDILAIVEKDGW